MNNANFESSDRLQKVYRLLKSAGRPLSTLDIIYGAGVCAVNSIAAELRENNIPVKCQRTQRGKAVVYYYSLEQETQSV